MAKKATKKAAKLSREALIEKVDSLNATVEEWKDSTDQQITPAVFNAASELIALTVTEEVEDDARALVLAIDVLAAEFRQWSASVDHPTEARRNHGGAVSLWRALEAVNEQCNPPKPITRLEPLSLLETQYGAQQAARTYGWRNADGSPDIARVVQHRQDNTEEYTLGGVNPSHLKREAELNERWAARVVIQANGKKKPKPAPETLDELINLTPLISVAQILKMKPELTEAEIMERAAKFNVTLPGTPPGYAPARGVMQRQQDEDAAAAAEDEKVRRFALVDPLADFELDDRIVGLHDQGLSIGDIVEYLIGESVSPQKVAEVLDAAATTS